MESTPGTRGSEPALQKRLNGGLDGFLTDNEKIIYRNLKLEKNKSHLTFNETCYNHFRIVYNITTHSLNHDSHFKRNMYKVLYIRKQVTKLV